jgi:acetyl esterase/lipase
VYDVVYRQLPSSLLIKLDVYKVPASIQSELAALVVVHGGGWIGGCKSISSAFARDAADGLDPSAGFVTFSIDYRLACSDSPDPQIDPYCGWPFPTPRNDVEFAIGWVRTHVTEYLSSGQSWNGRVAVFGSSAGGNLAFEAAMHATGARRPDASVGWSGIPDIGYLSDGLPSCDHSKDPDYCRSGTDPYVGCLLQDCESRWNNASPITWVDSSDPATFIANATEELSPLLAATDFREALEAANVPFYFCEVGGSPRAHGLGLRNWSCDGTVWTRTMLWLDANT